MWLVPESRSGKIATHTYRYTCTYAWRHMNESWHTHDQIMSRISIYRFMYVSQMTYEGVIPHTRWNYLTHIRGRVRVPEYTWRNHVTHMINLCHTLTYIFMYISKHTYEGVMTHGWSNCVTHTDIYVYVHTPEHKVIINVTHLIKWCHTLTYTHTDIHIHVHIPEHIWWSHDTRVLKLCHTYRYTCLCTYPTTLMIQVHHMIKLCHTHCHTCSRKYRTTHVKSRITQMNK